MLISVEIPFWISRTVSLTYCCKSRDLNYVFSSIESPSYRFTRFLFNRTVAICLWPIWGAFTSMYVSTLIDDLCLVYALRIFVDCLMRSLSPDRDPWINSRTWETSNKLRSMFGYILVVEIYIYYIIHIISLFLLIHGSASSVYI